MNVPLLGKVVKDKRFNWYCSGPVSVAMLGGKECRIVLEGYDVDPCREDFHEAIANFLAGSPAILRAADEDLYRYYKDHQEQWIAEGRPAILTAQDLWDHVSLGDEPMVARNPHGDQGVYVSLECNCDWEEEHGLQIVFEKGLRINKLGPYDGHLTNTDSFGDECPSDVVYHDIASITASFLRRESQEPQ